MIVLEVAGIVVMVVGIALLIFRFQKSGSETDRKDENPAVATPFFSITGPAGHYSPSNRCGASLPRGNAYDRRHFQSRLAECERINFFSKRN